MELLQSILPWIQIALSVLIVGAVMMQQSEAGLGGAFGGDDSANSIHRTRRGFEKTIFHITIVLGVLFIATALLTVVL